MCGLFFICLSNCHLSVSMGAFVFGQVDASRTLDFGHWRRASIAKHALHDWRASPAQGAAFQFLGSSQSDPVKASACQADGAPPRGLEPHRFRFARMSKWSAQRRRPARRFLLQGQGRACFGRCAMEDFFLRSSEGVHWGDFVFASTAPLPPRGDRLRASPALPAAAHCRHGEGRARARGPRRAMARGRRTSYKRTQKDKSNTLRISHRSHFGSRYKLGCCGNASLFAEVRYPGNLTLRD